MWRKNDVEKCENEFTESWRKNAMSLNEWSVAFPNNKN